jgi:hypothetical protein
VIKIKDLKKLKALQVGVFFVVVIVSASVLIIAMRTSTDMFFATFTPPSYMRQLDGVSLRDIKKTNLRPVAIMMDNHEDARPSIGIKNASVVFETIAEGQITRMLAIFDIEEIPESVGPIRSLRPYFLDFAEEFNAIIFHVGGSPDALAEVIDKDHVDEFREGGVTFYRDSSRHAPHNAFTSSKRVKASIERNLFSTTTSKQVFQFGESLSSSAIPVSDVEVNFSESPYNVNWVFDGSSYERFVDEVTKEIFVDNLVVLEMNSTVIDAIGRREVKTTGSGRMWYVSDGKMVLGTWENDEETPLIFKDIALNTISLKKGKTWISIIDDESKFKFTPAE